MTTTRNNNTHITTSPMKREQPPNVDPIAEATKEIKQSRALCTSPPLQEDVSRKCISLIYHQHTHTHRRTHARTHKHTNFFCLLYTQQLSWKVSERKAVCDTSTNTSKSPTPFLPHHLHPNPFLATRETKQIQLTRATKLFASSAAIKDEKNKDE